MRPIDSEKEVAWSKITCNHTGNLVCLEIFIWTKVKVLGVPSIELLITYHDYSSHLISSGLHILTNNPYLPSASVKSELIFLAGRCWQKRLMY